MPEESDKPKYIWKREYTLVLVFNTLYVLVFYFIMKGNS